MKRAHRTIFYLVYYYSFITGGAVYTINGDEVLLYNELIHDGYAGLLVIGMLISGLE